MNKLKFQLVRSPFYPLFYFQLVAPNGEQLLGSGGYPTKQACLAAIAALKTDAPNDTRYQQSAALGRHIFNWTDPDGKIIAYGEGYPTAAARDQAVAAVQQDAPLAVIEDLTGPLPVPAVLPVSQRAALGR